MGSMIDDIYSYPRSQDERKNKKGYCQVKGIPTSADTGLNFSSAKVLSNNSSRVCYQKLEKADKGVRKYSGRKCSGHGV